MSPIVDIMYESTSPAGQLDLFVDYDEQARRRAEYDEWEDNPQTCPCCGTEELSGWLLTLNHGIEMDGTLCGSPIGQHPNYGGQCVAQSLVASHIAYFAKKPDRADDLDGALRDGRELGLDVAGILARAELSTEAQN